MPRFQITVRYGAPRKRYHVVQLEAPDLAAALVEAGTSLPAEVRGDADLCEVRPAPEPEADRPYLGEDGP